jgi:hypothetical protein
LNKSKTYTADVVEICENGDAIIQFSDEMINDLQWKPGDVIDITMIDGVVHLKNITKNPELKEKKTMAKNKTKIVLYEQAPYIQGYNSAISKEEFYNPYSDIENAEADAEDYARGYENGSEVV